MTKPCTTTPARRFGLRVLAAGVSALAGLAMLPGSAPRADAAPIRTQNGWSVLLCKMSDVAATPQTPTFFSQFFGAAGAGMNGLYDFFNNQSYGKVKINADVRG